MQHPDDELLLVWLDGSLGIDRVVEIESHVSTCGQCDDTITNLEESRGTVLEAIRGVVESKPPPLLSAVREDAPESWLN